MCTFLANSAFDTATYERTNKYKTRDVVNTYLILNVTFEDLFSNALTFDLFVRSYVAVSKVKFAENLHIVLFSPY